MSSVSLYSLQEERANSLTHALGVILSVIGLVLLILKATQANSDALTLISMSVYGGSMVTLFLASTLYHSIDSPNQKHRLKTFDHCAIYLLIAGSYTPFMLVCLRTPLAVSLMVVIWMIAVVGIVMKLFFAHKIERLSLFVYLGMGWLSVIPLYQLSQSLDFSGLMLLALGGVVYTLGAVFYACDRIPFNHAIWHVFVLAGAACHFFAIYLYVEPI
ncbi:hemolysin III family protein [Vibrio sp. 10N.286.49.C2]|uniref:PAQR family membrane homeostasis protein TrhA n=1 Tax=unclassified Vibrio TaxID=2614977 RepID=UPI000C83B9EC|nr:MULTISPECIES: hemolysin III family protein [unclassified Vibrio]PMH36519.1 hemolysin III family protein [Vibrio sp. 10N.286.49.C2]PMH52424.1 hemolysin III family protein [Vibrio sp. 10N.286.49.B1]PMH83552.1 hemolysin III family protein [Vibrio sp. 10N.286.48.B7]